MSDSNNTEQGQELLPAERRARIMEWFATNQVVSTQDLAQSLNSSISTIRRDLDRLASDGLVKRTHGGAVRVRRNTTYEQRSDEARTTSVEEKMAIAGAAVAILQPGESVILDSRSTSHQLAYALAELTIPLTVVTNDVHIAGTLANRDHITLVVPGGVCRHGAYVLLGETGTRFVRELNCDHYFLCCQAIDQTGATDTALELVQLQKAMVGAAMETTLIIESSKFGGRAIYNVAPIEKIKRIITDEGLSTEERDKYGALVEELIVAPYLDDMPPELDERSD